MKAENIEGENLETSELARKKKTTRASSKKTTSKSKKLSSASTEYSTRFSAHIERIKASKQAADDIATRVAPMDVAEASVALLWEIVFDYLCSLSEVSSSEINAMSGVVQKLASVSRAGVGGTSRGNGGVIDKELIEKIEEQLKLL